MKFVVDANVAIKWFLNEPGTLAAKRLLDGDDDLMAPEHVLAEVAQALWRHFRLGEIPRVQVREVLTILPQFLDLIPLEEVVADAGEIACDVAHTVYDCLYVAVAIRHNADLVTADDRLLAALSRSRWFGRARSLDTF